MSRKSKVESRKSLFLSASSQLPAPSSQFGFTLIEVIISLALLSTALLSATQSYAAISRLQQRGITTRAIQQDGRYILEAIVRDARSAAVVEVNNASQITLTNSLDVGSKTIYRHVVSTNKLERLYCRQNPTDGVLTCENPLAISSDLVRVTSARFERVAVPNGIKPFIRVDLTVRQQDAALDAIPTDVYSQVYELSTIITPRDR